MRCAKNSAYRERPAASFLTGKTPPDFAADDFEVDFTGRGTVADLTELGRRTAWHHRGDVQAHTGGRCVALREIERRSSICWCRDGENVLTSSFAMFADKGFFNSFGIRLTSFKMTGAEEHGLL